MEKIGKRIFSLTVIFLFVFTVFAVPNSLAKKKDKKKKGAPKVEEAEEAQVPVSPPLQAPSRIKPYEGEITDEMLTSFLRADQKIRELRRQIGIQTQQILNAEKILPEVYIAVIQRSRQDANFLERVRARAAELVTEERTGA